MKIEFLVTVRCVPESKEELIKGYATSCAALKEEIDKCVQYQDTLPLPNKNTKVRYLFDSGRFE